jgi:hypothetical protein
MNEGSDILILYRQFSDIANFSDALTKFLLKMP